MVLSEPFLFIPPVWLIVIESLCEERDRYIVSSRDHPPFYHKSFLVHRSYDVPFRPFKKLLLTDRPTERPTDRPLSSYEKE